MMVILATIAYLCFCQSSELAPAENAVRPQYHLKPTYGPLLADVSTKICVRARKAGQTGLVTIPIPSDYSGQTVIAFRVQTEPTIALQSWKWQNRPDGLNRVANVTIDPKGEDVIVSCTARILVPGFEVLRTQKRDFGSWLGATATVESDSPNVLAAANQLKAGNPKESDFVGRVVRWTAANRLELSRPVGDRAIVEAGEDSLIRANTCAAILRAAKIPARVVAQVPRWAEHIEAETWLVEYKSEDGNWQMIDPFVGVQYPVRNTAIVLSISSRRDESHSAGNPQALFPEAPTLSTTEISSELIWAPSNSKLRHMDLHIIRDFPRASGARLMPGAHRRSLKVSADAKKGQATWYDDETFKKVIAKGPINLALFLDGQPTMPDHQPQ